MFKRDNRGFGGRVFKKSTTNAFGGYPPSEEAA